MELTETALCCTPPISGPQAARRVAAQSSRPTSDGSGLPGDQAGLSGGLAGDDDGDDDGIDRDLSRLLKEAAGRYRLAAERAAAGQLRSRVAHPRRPAQVPRKPGGLKAPQGVLGRAGSGCVDASNGVSTAAQPSEGVVAGHALVPFPVLPGDVVWGLTRGQPAWPALVITKEEADAHRVPNFGSNAKVRSKAVARTWAARRPSAWRRRCWQ